MVKKRTNKNFNPIVNKKINRTFAPEFEKHYKL